MAIKIRVLDRGTPAAANRSRIGGSVTRFGAGRVMSQTEMAAEAAPRASSLNEGESTGWSSDSANAAGASASAVAARASKVR